METMNFDEASPADSSAEALAKAGGGASQEGENLNSAPKAPGNEPRQSGARKKKLIWAGIILAVLILSVIGWQYWQYTQSVYYKQMKAVKMIEKDLKEQDKWGGKTPEETVRMFTEAVKKGDFELASKYGKPEIKSELEKMKVDGKIDQLIKDLENGTLEMTLGFGGNAADLIINENNVRIHIMGMYKSDGGTWKIVEF